jgi:hypothetical protein
MFAKARVGIRSDSMVITSVNHFRAQYGRLNLGVLDLGAIGEVYMGQRLALRLEASDVTTSQAPITIPEDGVPIANPGGGRSHSLEFSFGPAWRFW